MSTRNRKEAREQVLSLLQLGLADLFDRENPKPLALGTRQKLAALLPEVPGWKWRAFLSWWCNRQAYLRAVAADGSKRYGLNGKPGRVVSKADRDYAQSLVDAERERQRIRSEMRVDSA